MRLLLDTHTFLWFGLDAAQLSAKALDLISDAENERFLSVASVWELAIKVGTGKLKLGQSYAEFLPDQLQRNQVQLLAIEPEHAVRVATMPTVRFPNGNEHKDPFDRLIIAQSLIEAIPIVGVDAIFDLYGVERLW